MRYVLFLALMLPLTIHAKLQPWSSVVIGMYEEEPTDHNYHAPWIKKPYAERVWDEKEKHYTYISATQEQRDIYDLLKPMHHAGNNINEELVIWTHPQLKNKWLTRGSASRGEGWDLTWVVRSHGKYKMLLDDEKIMQSYGINPKWADRVCVSNDKDHSCWVDLTNSNPVYVTKTVKVFSREWDYVVVNQENVRDIKAPDLLEALRKLPDDATDIHLDATIIFFKHRVFKYEKVVEEQ